ncbi:AAA family ATPase [Fibrella aquatica]|uniref:AAA family ATPase n=1 Tax=Fibrella aquatica TaxID=3242487 RepID=UPI003522FDC9
MQPFFYLIAGPPGVGKSTVSVHYVPRGIELINADQIAQQLLLEQIPVEAAQQMAHDEAQRRIQRHLRHRTSFAVETTLHDIETWQFYLAVQQAGYQFRLLFLGVDDLPMLYLRVRNRQLQGGLSIGEDAIRGRYVAGFSVLDHFFNEPDSITLIDTANRPEIVYQRVDGIRVRQWPLLPAWVSTHLTVHVKSDATVGF